MKSFSFLATAIALLCPAYAQLPAPNPQGVSMGHIHLNVSDMAAQTKFWTEVMGGTASKLGNMEVIKLPDAFIILTARTPTGGTKDETINHFGLKVKDLAAYKDRLTAAGVTVEANPNGKQAMVTGPDGVRVELALDPALATPVANHHIHFYTTSIADTQKFYIDHFGAIPGKRGPFEAADLPGVNLSFSENKTAVPTLGRALDHIGFEVKNLEAFCKKLEAEGIHFELPYRKVPEIGLAIAFFTDPWGTRVELTEGLNKL